VSLIGVLYIISFGLNMNPEEKQTVSQCGVCLIVTGGLTMKTNKKVNALMALIAAVLFVFVMASPVMADRYGTFQGTISPDGQLMTTNGSQYWLNGRHSSRIEQHVGKKVEIKGLLRENTDAYSRSLGGLRHGPSIEVYNYEWENGMNKMNEMK
jgi:hypothetical protein